MLLGSPLFSQDLEDRDQRHLQRGPCGQDACKSDLQRKSTRAVERVRPLELGDCSTYLYEGSQAHAGRARIDVRIGWAHQVEVSGC